MSVKILVPWGLVRLIYALDEAVLRSKIIHKTFILCVGDKIAAPSGAAPYDRCGYI